MLRAAYRVEPCREILSRIAQKATALPPIGSEPAARAKARSAMASASSGFG